MKKANLFLTLFICIGLAASPAANAQQLQTMFGNTAFGAATGAALGGATMALQNSGAGNPITFGIGAGILGGVGIGAYDLTYHRDAGAVSGLFNTMPLTGAIILLDTAYGAGAGALVGIAFTLMGAGDFVDGLRIGAGVGAWAGFAFGLIDAFYFTRQSSGDDMFFDYGNLPGLNGDSGDKIAAGFLNIHNDDTVSVSLINPVFVDYNDYGVERNSFGIEAFRMRVNL